MFEVIGYYILRFLGLRRHTSEEVFGSYFDREGGAAEFIVGFSAVMIACFAITILFH